MTASWHRVLQAEQFGRGFNFAATSALGHVTVALASAAPELDSTPINKLNDDKRSVVFDGTVRSCLSHKFTTKTFDRSVNNSLVVIVDEGLRVVSE